MNTDYFRSAWCRETAHPSYQEKWSIDNPSCGQCVITALYIQEKYGGDIYACKVGNNSHFVNIINERIIDKTADQFGGQEKIKYISGSFKFRTRESLLRSKDVRKRYQLFKERMVDKYEN